MKLNRTQSVVEYKLYSSFEALRKKLLSEQYAESMEKPLAYWTMPSDRRLPLAFMGRTLRDVLHTPFEELYSTPGVGQKKIGALVQLLNRIATHPAQEGPGVSGAAPKPAKNENKALPGEPGFDHNTVSESAWQHWRAAVLRHGLEKDVLGRFAASLQDVPRVVWNTPLENYVNLTLAQVRSLRTHGEKRVRVVVETFGMLHRILGSNPPVPHLRVRVRAAFVEPLERWILDVLERPTLPTPKEMQKSFIEPLARQIRHDAGEQIARLVEGRLGLGGPGSSVKQFAKRLGLTRARVYQLLNEVTVIMQVRWPEAHPLVNHLENRIKAEGKRDDYAMFFLTLELFFAERHRGAPNFNGYPGSMELANPRQAG